MRSTSDGHDSLLDNSTIIYGAGMADSNSHYSRGLPILLAGSAVGKGGYHMQYPENTPLTNLHLSLLDKINIPIDSLGGFYWQIAVIISNKCQTENRLHS